MSEITREEFDALRTEFLAVREKCHDTIERDLTEKQAEQMRDRLQRHFILLKKTGIIGTLIAALVAAGGTIFGSCQAARIGLDVDDVKAAKEEIFDAQASLSDLATLPVGSIVAWHNVNLPEQNQKLPYGWVRCSGPIGQDQDEYIEGAKIDLATLPDLNRESRFLRGGERSGDFEKATLVANNPNSSLHVFSDTVREGDGDRALPVSGWHGDELQPQRSLQQGFRFSKTRPINMSVVWIIRVK